MINNNTVRAQAKSADWLLQLPDTALLCVLQQLDVCSLACAAVTCSKLRHIVPASIRQLVVEMVAGQRTVEAGESFGLWFGQHKTCMTCLTHLSLTVDGSHATWDILPSFQLRHLHLRNLPLQLAPLDLDGSPGVLHYCSLLTALDLQYCEIEEDGQAACAAIAALPDLQHLSIQTDDNSEYMFLLPALQQMTKLTYLSLDYWDIFEAGGCDESWQEVKHQLQQSPLSALVNLQHLRWRSPGDAHPFDGLPGGLPSQLVKLTCLDVSYEYVATAKSQLQQLSSLTALQDLRIDVSRCQTDDFPGVAQLSQLKSLGLKSSHFVFSTASTSRWAPRMAALERLSLVDCDVQLAAIAVLTQLRALRLTCFDDSPATRDFLVIVSQLQLLTELRVHLHHWSDAPAEDTPSHFTASTKLCFLQLGFESNKANAPLWQHRLFRPGHVYPHLRCLDLDYQDEDETSGWAGDVPLSEQQLQQLCGCCPAVESLAFVPSEAPLDTSFYPYCSCQH